MSTENIDICKLEDLDKLRSAPKLNKKQSKNLLNQLIHLIHKSDWITIGIMSPTLKRVFDCFLFSLGADLNLSRSSNLQILILFVDI